MSTRAVLVVEDNPLTRKMLRVTLETAGHRVVEAADGRSALEQATRSMPALILQDLILPDTNGFDLVRQLRALPGGATTPILALSGFLGRIDDARSIDAGFTALLVKPIEPDRLLEAIDLYLPSLRDDSIRMQVRRVLVVDDDPVQLNLMRLHLKELGFEVATASTSSDGLRLVRTETPDVVLADVLMPEVDGFELCRTIRSDPKLRSIPVVLTSAWYQSDADCELARRYGASALVQRTSDMRSLAGTLAEAIDGDPPPASEEPSAAVRLAHAKSMIHQLERRVALGADLARRCTLQAAQISLLGGVADALAHERDRATALRDVLAATLDAAGISKGALYLRQEGGTLTLRHTIGFSATEVAGLSDFFGRFSLLAEVVDRQTTIAIPSSVLAADDVVELLARAGAGSVQVVSLVSDGRGIGAMVLAAKDNEVTNEDSIAFARAMGNQLAQSLELADSFARLSTSEERYRTVTEAANDAISILGPDGTILEVNASLEATLGLPRARIVGHHIHEFTAPALDGDGGASFADMLEDGARPARPLALRKAGGELALMEFSTKVIELGGQKVVVAVGRDVTERMRTQAQLMVSDRMASVGTLAAGVAHEINNPLAAVVANLDLAVRELAELREDAGRGRADDLQEMLVDAREAAERVRIIVRDLKVFSRAEDDTRGPVDIRRVIESSLRMAWNEIRHRAQVVREYADVPAVEANESRLGQVFLNLVVNAAQALPDGFSDTNRIFVRTLIDPSERVVAEIQDTGPGIAPGVIQRLFTPFFTTKPQGVGTGLGLVICQRIVASLGGEIMVDSVLGRGTTFRVALLPARSAVVSRPVPVAATMPASRRARVLVVDDEPSIGKVVRRMLTDHEVRVTTDANEALGLIATGEHFDVIVCDVMMPVVTGVEFFAELQRSNPDLAARTIFLTGGAFTVKARAFLDEVPNARLEKPFDAQTLRALVNERLG